MRGRCSPRREGPRAPAREEPHPGAARGAARHLGELPEPHRAQPAAAHGAAPHPARPDLRRRPAARSRDGRARAARRRPHRGVRRSDLRGARPHQRRRARARRRDPHRRARGAHALPGVPGRARGVGRRSPRRSPTETWPASTRSHLPTEEVCDLLQRHMNHFPELEDGAEALWREAQLDSDDLYAGLVPLPRRQLGRPGADRAQPPRCRARCAATTRSAKVLALSEVLRRGSRNFQLAHQIGLLTQADALDRIARGPAPHDRRVARARAGRARELLRRRGAHAVRRVPRGGARGALRHRAARPPLPRRASSRSATASPRCAGRAPRACRSTWSASTSPGTSPSASARPGIRFARFSGACPRWNVLEAFTHARADPHPALADAGRRDVLLRRAHRDPRGRGGYHAPRSVQSPSAGLRGVRARGARLRRRRRPRQPRARSSRSGVTCRLCERMDCEQRAFPPLQHPLSVDENVRGVSFYAPVERK